VDSVKRERLVEGMPVSQVEEEEEIDGQVLLWRAVVYHRVE
jgi:hypothetical protein